MLRKTINNYSLLIASIGFTFVALSAENIPKSSLVLTEKESVRKLSELVIVVADRLDFYFSTFSIS